MATSGGFWRWHGPGPGTSGAFRRRKGRWKDDLLTTTSTRPPVAQEKNTQDLCQGRSNVTYDPCTLRWCLVVLLLVSCLSSSVDACANTTCPTGCRCADVPIISGATGCAVNCSSVTVTDIRTLLSSIRPPDKVTTLFLHNCSISTVPDNAFTSFTSLETVDLSYNHIQKLGTGVFHTLTNLEVLRLQGNKLQTLPTNIFAGRRRLRELRLSSNSLGNIDANLFSDLEVLEALYLDNNALTHLPLDLFKNKIQMAKIDLSRNPWHCDCALGAVIGWARAQQRLGHLLHPGSTRCASPTGVKDKEWSDVSLQLTQLACNLSALSSCFHESRTVSKPAMLYDSVPTATDRAVSCNRACAQRGRSIGVFQQRVLCLCGTLRAPSAGCCSSNNASCLPGAFPASIGLLLGPLHPVSTLSNMEFSLKGAVTNFSTEWWVGDGSDPVSHHSRSSNPLLHNYLLAGQYNVTVQGAGMSLQYPVQVVDAVGSARLVAPNYSDAENDLDIHLEMGRGSNVIVRWSRFDAAKAQIFGKRCSFGWHQHRIHTCVRSFTSADVINKTMAQHTCAEEQGDLLTFSDDDEMKALLNLLSKELKDGSVQLVGAERVDAVRYKWTHSKRDAYFNTSVVTSPLEGLCVGLSATGLRGLNCTNLQKFICKKGQVICKHGGEEWNKHSCLVPMGEDSPLNQSEAEIACEAIQGHLAVIDAKDKADFLHTQVLNNSSVMSVWLGLTDRHTPGLFLWPGGFSLGAFAPWNTGFPVTSSSSAQMCVSMATRAATTTWSSVECSKKMPFVCEYPTNERIAQVQTTLSGCSNFTLMAQKVTTTNATSVEPVTNTSSLILIPGYWFPHVAGVRAWRFIAQNLSRSAITRFRLQVHRPVCRSGYFAVPPGCTELPSPFATCSASPVSCSVTPQKCPRDSQFCPLLGRCLGIISPCACAALGSASSTGCSNASQYTAHPHLTSPPVNANAYRFNGTAPHYRLMAETRVVLQPGSNGTYNVDAGDIQVQPNDIIGVQFISGDESVLCDTVAANVKSAGQAQSILDVVLPIGAAMSNIDVNSGSWKDSMVCNIQAISTIPTSAYPPANLRKGSVHSVGTYTYRASLYGPLSDKVHIFEKDVIMQNSVKGLTLAYPEPKYPRRTGNAYKLAIVEAESWVNLLWYITRGTDPMAKWAIPGTSPTFISTCPSTLSHISMCSNKNYQFLTNTMATGKAGNITTVTVSVWNMVSNTSLTIDILAQEKITNLGITKSSTNPTEIQSTYKSITFMAFVSKGTDIGYVWDFGDGKTKVGTQSSVTHAYIAAGIYTIHLTASNQINSDTITAKMKLFKKANVRNLSVSAPSNVDLNKEYSIDVSMVVQQGSSITVYIYFGEKDQRGNRVNEIFIDQPEFQANGGTVSFTRQHKYTKADKYTITVLVLDNLYWANKRTNVMSLIGQSYVKSVTHGLQAWTVLTGLQLSSTPACQPVNQEVTFHVTFPAGFTKLTFNFTWNFGDKSPVTYSFEKDFAKHTFSIANTYDITLHIQNNDSKGMVIYKKCIEKPISALSLSPKISPMALAKGRKVTSRFDVLENGSDLQYKWTYNSQTSHLAPNAFSIDYRAAGSYTVKLNVSNHISYKVAETNVVVVEVIAGLAIAHNGFVSGSYSYFKSNVQYDLEPETSSGSDMQWQWKIDAKPHSSQKKISITWSSVKSHRVSVTAVNPVGQASQTITIVVEEPVSLTNVTTFSDSHLGDTMKLTAVASGTTVKFNWSLCVDHSSCSLMGSDRELVTTPSITGMHNYTVCAYNHVSIMCNSSVTQIWAKLQGVSIIPPASIVAGWAKLGENLTFKADIIVGKATSYQWVLTTKGQVSMKMGNQQTFTMVVYEEATCLLTLTATNPMETVKQTYTFNVEEVVIGLEIHALLGDRAYTGETLAFKATWTNGSYPKYKWTIIEPGETKSSGVLSRTDEVSYKFNTVGSYELELNVINKVTNITKVLPIEIKNKDLQHKIVVEYDSQPWVHQNILIDYHVEVGAGIAGSVTGYSWSVYDRYPVIKSHGIKMSYNFTQQGTYIIEVRLTIQNQHEPIVIRKEVHVQGSLTGITLSQHKHIIASGEKINFNATIENIVDKLEYHWYINSVKESITDVSTWSHTFPGSGVFWIQVQAWNKVGFSAASVQVIVQDAITDIELENCCFYNASEPSVLIPHVSRGTNVTYIIKVTSPAIFKKVYGDHQFYFQFPIAGTYTVTITATNLVSTKQESISIYSQVPILDLIVKTPLEVYVGQSVVMKARVTAGTSVIYKWMLLHLSMTKNNVTRQEGESGEFAVNFTRPGTFILVVTAYNDVSSGYKTLVISSSLIRCEPMVLTAIGGMHRTELRSHPLDLEVSVTVNCTRYPIAYNWQVFKDCDVLEKKVTMPDDVTVNTPHLVLAARSLNYGTYCVKFSAKYERTPVIIDVIIGVNITKSALQVSIDGGSERRMSVNKEMVFHGDSSYDPDLKKAEPSKIQYHWTCESVTTKASCFTKRKSTATVSIPAKRLELGKYNVTLRISKPGRQDVSTSQLVVAVKGPVAEVFIVCVSCLVVSTNKLSSGQPYKLLGKCSNCSNEDNVQYSWTITRDDNEELKIDSTTSTTGGDKTSLVIKQRSFNSSHGYTFKLTVTDPILGITGYSKLFMGPNKPPTGGTCHVANKGLSVVALEERLDVRCKDWKDPDDRGNSPLIYQVSVESQNQGPASYWYTLYSGSKASGLYDLAPLTGQKETVRVKVEVIDKLGGKTLALSQEILVQVKLPPNVTHFAYLYNIMQHNFPVLVLHQTPRELFQFTIALAHQLNLFTDDTLTNQLMRIEMRINIITALTDMDFAKTLSDFNQLSYLLKQLTEVPKEFPQNEQSCEDLLNLVDIMLSWMDTHGTTATNSEDVAPDNVMSIITNMINGLQAMLPVIPTTTTVSPSVTPGATQRVQTTATIPEWQKAVMLKSMNYLDEIMHQFSKTKVPEENGFVFTSQGMSATGQRVMADKITNFANGGFSVTLPPKLFQYIAGPVFQSVIVMDENPLQWGFNKNKVSSNILGLRFRHNNGSIIEVKNLAHDQRITLVMPASATKEKVSMNSSRVFKAGESFKTSFNASDFSAGGLNIEIRGTVLPLGNKTGSDRAHKLALTAYLGYGYEPFWYKNNGTLQIRHNSTGHQNYTFFMVIDDKTPAMIYVTVKNDLDKHSVNITIEPYEVICQFYDSARSSWSTAGCEPTAASNKTSSVCLCDHLTIFGASSTVSPTDIDFSDLTRLDLADNPVVVILVSVIAGIFIVALVWARQYDLQDLHNISIVPLCGKDGFFKYEVIINTGRKRGAGTSSHVGIKLYGVDGKSGARHLARHGAFQRNSEDSFLVATEVSLGQLHKVHLWHDNTGRHPSWYVNRVAVRDLQTNKKTFFLVNSWLSLTVEKGTLDKQVFAAAPEELTSFGTVFHSETSRGFAERHVWLSVWDRPARSRFTRVQRVVCCATLLYSFMCANVMWYGLIRLPEREVQALGLVSIEWQDFVVGILASIVVFPINIAIIQIFRFTKVKVNARDYENKPGTALTIEVEATCDISQAGDSYTMYDRRNSGLMHSIRRGSSLESILMPVESKKWWSYDTILKWPEKMPSDPRPDSTMMPKAGPLKKRSALRFISPPKDMEPEELIIDDDTLKQSLGHHVREANNNQRIPATSTSGTLSISQSIAEIEEDMVVDWSKPECSKKYESLQMKTLQVPSNPGYGSGEGSSSSSHRERADSWSNSSGGKNPNLLSPYQPFPSEPKSDSDSGEVRQAMVDINTNIKEAQLIEPRLLNRKKSSMNQGNIPSIDILRLPDPDQDSNRDPMDDDMSDQGSIKPRTVLQKTISKSRISKRWAQIVIPPEYETYKNDHFRIFDPEDDYDAVSLNRSNTIKSRVNSLGSNTTTSSRFHQLMPSTNAPVRWLLPHWAVFVAYGLCFILSGMSIIITILYGHSFGRDLALKWLLAFFISFLDSVFILEPLNVLALAVFLAILTRGLTEEDEGIETRPVIESNEKLRDVRMRPIGGFALLQAREEGSKVVRMHRLMRHACVYLLFMACVFFITYNAHNINIFPVTRDVQLSLVTPSTTTGTNFSNIQRTQDMWSWLSEVAAPALYPNQTDSNKANQRLLLGEARLRQVRSVPVTCQAEHAIFKLKWPAILDHDCYGDPSWQEDMEDYHEGWTPASGNGSWAWTDPAQAHGEWHDGGVDGYGGGGYIQGLGPTLAGAQNMLAKIAQSNWTDRGTRAIFVEATLYTVPTHLHTTVRILAEIPVTGGGVWMSHEVLTFQLANHVSGQVNAIMIFMALLSIIWLYPLFVVLRGLRRHTWRYFLSFWRLMELTITIIVFSLVVAYIHRVAMDTWTHGRHTEDPKAFNGFFASMAVYRVWKSLSGFLIFLLTIWMVRVLRFVKPLAAYGRTLKVAGPRLGGAVLLLIILIFSISHFGHLWFGAVLCSYRSLGSSFVTVFGLVRARAFSVVGAMHEMSPHMTGFLLFAYIGTVMIVTMGIFMAVLNTTYRMVRLQAYYRTSMEMPDHEMINFMMKRFRKYIGITKPKPAFRRVKFQGMPSLSSRSSVSSRTGLSHSLVSSGSSDIFGLDTLEEEGYQERLLERCVPTWTHMLEKFERVLRLDCDVAKQEEEFIRVLSGFLNYRHGLNLKLFPRTKRGAAKAIDAKALCCHRSNSESVMTDVRAQQIREALNAELDEMEEKIMKDVETPRRQHHKKSMSFTEATGRGKADSDSLNEYDLKIHGECETGVIQTTEGDNPTGDNPPIATSPDCVSRSTSAKPPSRLQRFLNSADHEWSFPDVKSALNQELPSTAPRRASAIDYVHYQLNSPALCQGDSEEVNVSSQEAQMFYGGKVPSWDMKVPEPLKPNSTHRPTSEQSERIKNTPSLPLPKQDL